MGHSILVCLFVLFYFTQSQGQEVVSSCGEGTYTVTTGSTLKIVSQWSLADPNVFQINFSAGDWLVYTMSMCGSECTGSIIKSSSAILPECSQVACNDLFTQLRLDGDQSGQ